jgi:hypothetical protein
MIACPQGPMAQDGLVHVQQVVLHPDVKLTPRQVQLDACWSNEQVLLDLEHTADVKECACTSCMQMHETEQTCSFKRLKLHMLTYMLTSTRLV